MTESEPVSGTSFHVDEHTVAVIATMRKSFGVSTNAQLIRKALALATIAIAIESSLDPLIEQFHLSVDEQIELGDQSLRRWMAIRIVWTFMAGNIQTLIVLGGCAGWIRPISNSQ